MGSSNKFQPIINAIQMHRHSRHVRTLIIRACPGASDAKRIWKCSQAWVIPVFKGVQPHYSGGCFQIHDGYYAAYAYVGALFVVNPEPNGTLPGSRYQVSMRGENSAVVTLDVGILPGLAGLDVFLRDVLLLSSFHQSFNDVFRTTTNPNGL